jgi:hypothetical protein
VKHWFQNVPFKKHLHRYNKGLVVPGGKADMMFTATNFGDDEAEDEDDAFMDFL